MYFEVRNIVNKGWVMKRGQHEFHFSEPHIVSAVYFGILAAVASILTFYYLKTIGLDELLPLTQISLLAGALGALFGSFFAKAILRSSRKDAFIFGLFMILAALPVYNLFLIILMKHHHTDAFQGAHLHHLIGMYFIMLLYSVILVGLWLAPAAGFAAMFLRGNVVDHWLHWKEQQNQTLPSSHQYAHSRHRIRPIH